MMSEIDEPHIPQNITVGNNELFDLSEYKAYLSYCSISPASKLIKNIFEKWYMTYSKMGAAAYPLWDNQRNRLRNKIAKLMGCETDNIGYGTSVSQLIGDISLMIDWKKNDRILVFNGDFPSVIVPLQNTATIFDLKIVYQDIHRFRLFKEQALADIENELKNGVRLVAVSFTLFQTGCVMPIKEIALLCKKYGAELLVDAAQAFGAIYFDVTELGVDYLVAPTHKWLMGIEGTGILYVNPEAMKGLISRKTGWLSYENSMQFLTGESALSYDLKPKRNPSIIEMGVGNSIGLAALEAGISCHLAIGMKKITQHIQTVHDRLEEGLQHLGFTSLRTSYVEGRSSILSFLPPQRFSTTEIMEKFSQNGVSITCPEGYLRFAPHWPTKMSEIDYTIDSIKEKLGG
jgi:cysteine desulfurase / selenocysteine lyase